MSWYYCCILYVFVHRTQGSKWLGLEGVGRLRLVFTYLGMKGLYYFTCYDSHVLPLGIQFEARWPSLSGMQHWWVIACWGMFPSQGECGSLSPVCWICRTYLKVFLLSQRPRFNLEVGPHLGPCQVGLEDASQHSDHHFLQYLIGVFRPRMERDVLPVYCQLWLVSKSHGGIGSRDSSIHGYWLDD
jgi:hypothetical protein